MEDRGWGGGEDGEMREGEEERQLSEEGIETGRRIDKRNKAIVQERRRIRGELMRLEITKRK